MIMLDFLCEPCNEIFEDLVDRETRLSPCPLCGQAAERILSPIQLGQMNDPEKRIEALKKRSVAHTKREVKKEPERFGLDGDSRKTNRNNI